jgi:hemoglobin/transferrin/lactoferrin receptor protein
VLCRVNDCWQVYGGVSQAFRAPNLSDLTGTQLALSGLTSRGTPDLDPEEFVTAEIGTRFQSDTLAFALAGFYTWTDGAITHVVVGADSFATNGQDGYIYGFEAEAAWLFRPGWQLSGALAWQEGKTETAAAGERWMSRLLPLSGSVTLRWTHDSGKLWIEGRVVGATDADRIHPADQAADNQRIPTGGTPGYLAYRVQAGWQPIDALELTCGLENIANDDYRIHGSGQNEAGFGAIVGAKVKW